MLAIGVLAGGCSNAGDPARTPSPAAATPLVARPLPSAGPALTAELTLVAEALERTGDDPRVRHDRVQACIRLTRLREHAEGARLATADRVRDLRRAERTCPTDQAAAAITVRAAAGS